MVSLNQELKRLPSKSIVSFGCKEDNLFGSIHSDRLFLPQQYPKVHLLKESGHILSNLHLKKLFNEIRIDVCVIS